MSKMNKYLTIFESHSQYVEPEVKPNVSYCIQEDEVHYNPFDPFSGHEYVDLGLPSGTLWATCNIGLTVPTDDNSLHFGWGTTDTLDSYIDINTKYNTTDKKSRLELEDDAARVNWKGSWRIPTTSQIAELIQYTTRSSQANLTNSTWTLTSNINGNTLILKYGYDKMYPSSNPWINTYGTTLDAVSCLHPTNVSLYPGGYSRDCLCMIRPVINIDSLINDLDGVTPILNYEGPVYETTQQDFVVTLTSPISGTVTNATISLGEETINATTTDNLVFSGSASEEIYLNGPTLTLTINIAESNNPIILSASFKGYNPK